MDRCECGCGGVVSLAKHNNKKLGYVKGKPVRFLPGHHRRGVSPPLEERFRSRVAAGGPDECWEWTAGRIPAGYGAIWDGRINNNRLTHRLAWELANGQSVPEGMYVCHRCDNPPCCNPDHLFIGTHQDNDADRVAKGRTAKPGAKLSADQVETIRAELLRGRRGVDLAREFGVSTTTISEIKKRKTWS